MDTATENLLSERETTHGDTHYLAGVVIGVLEDEFIQLVVTHPELVYDWVQMLGKLIRILFSPTNIDHYNDIIGYATLAKRTLEKGETDDR